MRFAIKSLSSAIVAALLVSGCASTVTTERVVSTSHSFDGGEFNSGLVGLTYTTNVYRFMGIAWCSKDCTGGVITPHARERYNALAALYGSRFSPPVKLDDGLASTSTNTFKIDAQHLSCFCQMEYWRKNQK
jgi:hypothetical protein